MNLRRLRLRAVWLLVLPFLWLARPSPLLLAAGAPLALLGLLLRGWAAGTIRKERELTTGGPYAYTRNPLYLGSLLLGLGITVGGGHWAWPALFVAFFALVYGRTMASEERLLGGLFGERYAGYAAAVPALLPRLSPWRGGAARGGSFTWSRYGRNREWEAALGALAGFGFLALKGWLAGE
ncbi:MAG: isoprenylcysteine carboxylmethyltransferase family protein [Gemmatimonadetes bacterium]|nr:isoprenylcysteine carboxylmethyltransferase family protein [Gemmatimonadota bacterium]